MDSPGRVIDPPTPEPVREESRLEEDIAFAGWSEEDLRITREVTRPPDGEQAQAEQKQAAQGPRIAWGNRSRAAIASGAFAYEIASNSLPGVPGWVWGITGGVLVASDTVKAIRTWWRGEDSSGAN